MIGNPRLQRLARVDTHQLDQRGRYWRRLSGWSGWGRVGMCLGFFAIAMIYVPIALLALMSISQSPLSGIPYPLTLQHYGTLLSDGRWLLPLQKSVIMGVVVAFTCMLVATLVGRAITRMKRPGGVLIVSLIPLFVPGLTMGAALFIFLRTMLDLKLGLWSIFVAHMVWALPFALLLVLVVASRFDLRLLEAASDLGANNWQRFWQIEFPILRPGIMGAGIFGFLLSFNELLRSIFVRGQETTMPIYNWAMAASQQSQVPIIFALATIILLVTLPVMSIFFWLLFRKAG
ncbi:spermidine/putrescine transport system permease protein [Arboricoccus pini]|uniref:Spermidine/putrescine transport system permease protein n=1 Tax=Arboricoccus pini TaxID=1963835 RepID=A0A212RJA2_9PROT|nr:ABC transporter permease [Arboricoccus pini]SNB72347.1 spermidine/putrescine transport system permease protein [Arboricoccus pini]